jgi:hypothetical protein
VRDRETESKAPPASKWRKLKTSLFGQKTTPIEERLIRLPPQAREEAAPAPEPPPVEEAKREPEPTEDTPPAAPPISPEPPAEEQKDSRKKKGRSGSAKRQRQRGFMVRATEDEFNVIRERAASAGLSAGAFLRACALGDKGPRSRRALPLNSAVLIEALASLNRIGNNLNQIAHHLNAGGHPDRERIADSRAELSAMLQTILQALGRAE